MKNLFKKIVQIIKDPLKGRDLPSNYINKVIKSDLNNIEEQLQLRNQFQDYKINKHLLILSQEERIILSQMLEKKEDYSKFRNEIIHLPWLTLKEQNRGFFTKEIPILNQKEYKTGDIIISLTAIKYEVKTYTNLSDYSLFDITNQYQHNDFSENPVKFNIIFNDSKINIKETQQKLSNSLKIALEDIMIISRKELQEELTPTKKIEWKSYYNMPFQEYENEVKNNTIKQLRNSLKYIENRHTWRKACELLTILETKSIKGAKKTSKRLKKLQNPENCGAESSVRIEEIVETEEILINDDDETKWEVD